MFNFLGLEEIVFRIFWTAFWIYRSNNSLDVFGSLQALISLCILDL